MTNAGPPCHNKSVSMDIEQLRGWASIMDRAMIASLIVTVLAVAALGVSTFLSYRYGAALRAHDQAALGRYEGIEGQLTVLERDAATARDRAASLEQELGSAKDRTASLEQEVFRARDRAELFEQAARDAAARDAATREAAAREAAARDAAAREAAARIAPASPAEVPGPDRTKTPRFDAAAIRERLAELGKLVRDAATRPPAGPSEPTNPRAPEPAPPNPAAGLTGNAGGGTTAPAAPFIASLGKYTGTQVALFVLGQVSDAAAIGATLSADLTAAGWVPQTWTWNGVAGIFGVVVLIKDGSAPIVHETASTLVEALRSSGYSATKGDWPANWARFRGTLDGPQTPGPTDAAIRVVVGSKARAAP